MRIGLLDPRWLEQRDRAAADRSDRDEALAPGAAIEASLKQVHYLSYSYLFIIILFLTLTPRVTLPLLS